MVKFSDMKHEAVDKATKKYNGDGVKVWVVVGVDGFHRHSMSSSSCGADCKNKYKWPFINYVTQRG